MVAISQMTDMALIYAKFTGTPGGGVVVPIRPVKPEYGKDEKLIPGGHPIITSQDMKSAITYLMKLK